MIFHPVQHRAIKAVIQHKITLRMSRSISHAYFNAWNLQKIMESSNLASQTDGNLASQTDRNLASKTDGNLASKTDGN